MGCTARHGMARYCAALRCAARRSLYGKQGAALYSRHCTTTHRTVTYSPHADAARTPHGSTQQHHTNRWRGHNQGHIHGHNAPLPPTPHSAAPRPSPVPRTASRAQAAPSPSPARTFKPACGASSGGRWTMAPRPTCGRRPWRSGETSPRFARWRTGGAWRVSLRRRLSAVGRTDRGRGRRMKAAKGRDPGRSMVRLPATPRALHGACRHGAVAVWEPWCDTPRLRLVMCWARHGLARGRLLAAS